MNRIPDYMLDQPEPEYDDLSEEEYFDLMDYHDEPPEDRDCDYWNKLK